jgi:hypothetical protein
MPAKSTIDSARELLGIVARSIEPLTGYADAATICDVEDRSRIAEARRLLDELAPPTKPADPVQALRVALDYGAEREWPDDLKALVKRLLPELGLGEHPSAPQPDASWLRLVTARTIVDGASDFVYEGRIVRGVDPASDPFARILGWLAARDGFSRYEYIGVDASHVRIVTKIVLVGAQIGGASKQPDASAHRRRP